MENGLVLKPVLELKAPITEATFDLLIATLGRVEGQPKLVSCKIAAVVLANGVAIEDVALQFSPFDEPFAALVWARCKNFCAYFIVLER